MPAGSGEIFDVSQERIRLMHFTWIAFFITFYVWFNMAPLATTMLDDVGGEGGWLTKDHIKILAICNVALTIPARIFVGALLDRFGPRRVFSALLIVMAFPTFAFAFGNSFVQLLIARLLLSIIGAGFVIGIRMISQWFPPSMIGRAEGLYAGWGNFGSAWAAMTLPWIALSVFGSYDDGWRYAMALNGSVSLIYGFIYFFAVRDVPVGTEFVGTDKVGPMTMTSRFGVAQYLVWSIPVMGALGLLAWRVSRIDVDGEPIISQGLLWLIYGGLTLVYLAHVVKTLQVNIPYLRAGVAGAEKYSFGSVAALNTTYFANFGAELAVVSMLPAFFEGTFTVSPEKAGLVASSFAFVNLVARPLGGLVSDSLPNRKWVMVAYMGGIAPGFLAMSFIGSTWPLWVAIALTIMTSVFVQGAQGATYAIIPMVSRHQTGQVAGMVGAYGNVGAVVYLVVLSLVSEQTFFLLLAGGSLFSVVFCAIFLENPEGSFDEDYGAADDEVAESQGAAAN
jgi:NNP family nitrate/nitrite transporter-like MFS transporter